jgi:hypothetical protein
MNRHGARGRALAKERFQNSCVACFMSYCRVVVLSCGVACEFVAHKIRFVVNTILETR